MKRKYVYFLLGNILGINSLYAQYPNNCYSGDLTNYQTSWIANDGGTPYTHVPHSMDAIFVRGDGMVASITGWDEGGTNVGLWKDGKVYSVPYESGTGSWGRNSGKAVVLDDKYVYQLMIFNGNSGNDNLNDNGLRQYPPKNEGIEWQLITRYYVETGNAAPFKEGYGPYGNMLIVANQEGRYLKGLAIADNKLIVAVPGIPEYNIPDSIKIYDKNEMSTSHPLGGFKISEGGVGYIAADKRGIVWMLQEENNQIVGIDLTNGAKRFTINLPSDVIPKSFSVDTRIGGQERILVANSGKDLNVLIYTNIYSKNPTLSDTFGVTGGTLVKSPKPDGGEYLQGEMGNLRFPGPTGVGIDDNGNIYVSNMFPGTSTSVLYSYNENTKKLNWKLEGLVFTSTGDFDQTQHNIVYGTDKLYELDYSKQGNRMDKLIATTHDPFTFPSDFRQEEPSPIKCGVFKRKIQGEDFLFVTNMYSSILGGYRFDKKTHGYIAIPCMELRVDQLWEDKNGDGQKNDNEISQFSKINTFSIFPDKNGNIWMTDQISTPSNIHFKYFKLKGIDDNGVLQYESPISYKLPEYIIEVTRLMYDAERDEMIVGCYTQANPNPAPSVWGQVGTTVLVYKNIKEKLANTIANPTENWKHDQELILPASSKSGTGSVTDPGVEIGTKSIAFAGDYFFMFLAMNGKINVYNRETCEFIGQITPGTEVGEKSGWTDFTYALNARKNDDGSYELLGEENGYAKIIHYTIKDFNANIKVGGDLAPEKIWVLDGAKGNIDDINIPENQPIRFRVRVKNIEKGIVSPTRPSIPGCCLVQFTVTDLKTEQIVYEALSNVHEENISGGEYIDMDIDNSEPFWFYTQGTYRVDVNVNYGKRGKECTETNNYMSYTFGGGDNTGDISRPTGISKTEKKISPKIFPNPATTKFKVVLDEITENPYISITSIDGKKVFQQKVKNGSLIDVTTFPRGCYILEIMTSTEKHSQKIILK